MTFNKADVATLKENQAWREICVRLTGMLLQAQADGRKPGEYHQGAYWAKHDVIETVLGLPEQLEQELIGKGGVVSLR